MIEARVWVILGLRSIYSVLARPDSNPQIIYTVGLEPGISTSP
jgi:hypothetical protein